MTVRAPLSLPATRKGKVLLLLMVACLIVTAFEVRSSTSQTRSAVAYFPKTIGLYVGDDVEVLGVKVGKVSEITPEPGRAKVRFTFDRPVPRDVKAFIA